VKDPEPPKNKPSAPGPEKRRTQTQREVALGEALRANLKRRKAAPAGVVRKPR
jgi:hypothetical protein